MSAETGLAEIWEAVMGLAKSRAVPKLNTLPGCWEVALDDAWWIAVNGRPEPIECAHGVTVRPYHVYIEFNGWPAGFLSPNEGEIAAGEAANVDTLLAALRKASSDA